MTETVVVNVKIVARVTTEHTIVKNHMMLLVIAKEIDAI